MILKLLTVNVHKGFSSTGRNFVLPQIREAIREVGADLVFLQEVSGTHRKREKRYAEWPAAPQFEYLADEVWPHYAYAKNAVYRAGHHGSAILSAFPITEIRCRDVSASRLEQRGLLHAAIDVPGAKHRVHCFCVHLGLIERWRRAQVRHLEDLIAEVTAEHEPVIVAGDFNDFSMRINREMKSLLGLTEVYEALHGRPARSYPVWRPTFRLDRIYIQGGDPLSADRHADRIWRKLSDHAGLSAEIRLTS